MNDKGYDSKEIILTILREEQERQISIKKLKRELQEIERQGDMRDTKRITEIIDELNIIDPLSENKEFAGEKNKEANPKKRRFMPLKISAVCIMILLSIQVVSISVLSVNFFDWTKNTFLLLIGAEIQQDDKNHMTSNSREYKTIEEFETTENIKFLIPTWLPNNIEIENIVYAYDYREQRANLNYNDTTSLTIRLNSTISIQYEDEIEIYENNDILFYLFRDSNVIEWEYNGDFYNLTCVFGINEYAEKIIKNIK